MMTRLCVTFVYGYPIDDAETQMVVIKANNGEELARFYGEEAKELFSILSGYRGLFQRKRGTNMAAKKKAENDEKIIFDLNDGQFKTESEEKEIFDPITGPVHYLDGRKYEPRKVIEDWDLNFYLGNVVKYVSRAGRKGDAVEDLRKAKQYLEWEIERLEGTV